jgi:hypothetical protein
VLLLDEQQWRTDKKQDEPDRKTLTHVAGDAYLMAITERVAIPIPSLKRIALDNAREAAPDAELILGPACPNGTH